MKTSLGRIGGMLAIGVFLSTGRAWAKPDTDLQLTSQERKELAESAANSAAKVNALADLLVKRGNAESCAAGNVQVMLEIGKGDVVECRNDAHGAYKIILDSERIKGSPFFIARVWGKTGFLPQRYILMYKGAKTLQESDAAVSPQEVSAALDRARLKRLAMRLNALNEIDIKVEPVSASIDSLSRVLNKLGIGEPARYESGKRAVEEN